jgi:hypothetical protein
MRRAPHVPDPDRLVAIGLVVVWLVAMLLVPGWPGGLA